MSKARNLMARILNADDHGADLLPVIRFEGRIKGTELQRLDEGKWVKGRFDRSIRIDLATHLLRGDVHGHVYGRNGDELVVVNIDGSASHGKKGRLHPDDAEALRKHGFRIPVDRIVEWWEAGEEDRALFQIQ
ncbi:hypothetical protein [Methylobacterium sp. GC_Met_2]|uniref:hypothetical protein n=1 Tax=Methylobacterium sp. GC_Met_2 TaxID=2937376 RepID=UPI00226B753F|nr:hypothetical protein [Methylobacterium sp. GC_Met_2]